jgi:hypothetical protein
MKARGSAIIIAMLMITAIGGIAFAIGRLLFIESVSASYYVNGSIAYYAAESGLEEGFLRYRYNRNAEVPFATWELGDDKVFRTDLTANTTDTAVLSGILSSESLASTSTMNQLYDLRMGYIGTGGAPWFGPPDKGTNGMDANDFPTPVDNSAPYYIKKDEAIKIDLTGLNLSNELKLDAKFYGLSVVPTEAQKCNALIEAKMTVVDSGVTKEYKSLISYNKTNCGTALITKLYSGGVQSAQAGTSTMYYRVNRLQDIIDIDNYGPLPSSSAKVTLFLKPLYYDMAIGISTDCLAVGGTCIDKTMIVSGPSTKIESTGYYGGTTRKLEADIDRQSGTLYDLFDYVIYKGS